MVTPCELSPFLSAQLIGETPAISRERRVVEVEHAVEALDVLRGHDLVVEDRDCKVAVFSRRIAEVSTLDVRDRVRTGPIDQGIGPLRLGDDRHDVPELVLVAREEPACHANRERSLAQYHDTTAHSHATDRAGRSFHSSRNAKATAAAVALVGPPKEPVGRRALRRA